MFKLNLFAVYNANPDYIYRVNKLYKTMQGAQRACDKFNAKLGREVYKAAYAEDYIALWAAHKNAKKHSIKA